jgi:uncharacterized membrane protein
MSFIDVFAWFVLIILIVAAVVIIAVLGALPGRVARARKHPHADAVSVAGWLGLLFLGVFWPLAMVWAYVDWPAPGGSQDLADIQRRVAMLEAATDKREAAE